MTGRVRVGMTLSIAAALFATLGDDGAATESTSYCLRGRMADGTYTRAGSAAHNGLALGTHIYVRPAFYGRHRFVVRDRIGWGTELDLWAPSCGTALAWGRRTVSLSVGWPRRHPFRARVVARPIYGSAWRWLTG